ncbi:MAG TPA: hypothetical protein VJU18_18345 [Vicinamibacteria bacterium]|nr:hypothetical protein [Vicinamibacteria bacterium]
MAQGERIDLHGISQEIRAVQKRLKAARRSATEEERDHIDKTIQRLEEVHGHTTAICPKAYGVWPTAGTRRTAVGGGKKKRATKARSKK